MKIAISVSSRGIARATRRSLLALLCAFALTTAVTPARAASPSDDAAKFKPFIVEQIGIALAGAKEMQTAVKAGDLKAAQAAWIKSRKGWEAMEPVTGEYFGDLDKLIDAWPDAKHGYHAIEASLFTGKLDSLSEPVGQLVDNLGKFERRVAQKNFKFSAQRLLSGTANLAYEVGEEKSKGGESPYAGTSVIDMQQNVRGIEAAYALVFADTLKKRDAKLAGLIHDRIEKLEKLLQVETAKQLDAKAVHVGGEELAVLLQSAAPKLGLKTFKVGDEDEAEKK
jgi:iron uptake system EfeUOB component EfeO/EfeM